MNQPICCLVFNLQSSTMNIHTQSSLLCLQERMKRAVAALGEKEVEDLIKKQGNIEVTCAFCNDTYQFTKDQIDELSTASAE